MTLQSANVAGIVSTRATTGTDAEGVDPTLVATRLQAHLRPAMPSGMPTSTATRALGPELSPTAQPDDAYGG